MVALRFTTTRLSELRAAGRLQEMQHATIAPLLEREFGQEYGRLFADFESESSDVRAWYTAAQAQPRAIATLTEPEAELLRQRVAEMIARITAFAATMSGQSTQSANIARILMAATTFPIEDLWVDGTQPLIVNWGFHRRDVEGGIPRPIRDRMRAAKPGVMPGVMPGAVPAAAGAAIAGDAVGAAQPPLAAARPAKRRRFFLSLVLWLAFATLVAMSFERLLPACGLAGPFGLRRLASCPLSAAAARVFEEGAELQATVEAAELEAARRRGACPPARRAALAPGPGATGNRP